MINNKELPAIDLLTNPQLTIYDYVFDIKDVSGKLLSCEFDKLPYALEQKLVTGLLVNVFQSSNKQAVDKGIVKNRDETTETIEILTQNGVVKRDIIKSYFVKVVPSYNIAQQAPKWVDTKAFISNTDNNAILYVTIDTKYTEGYIKWSLVYIDEEDKKRKTIAVGNDNFSKGIVYIKKQNKMFKKGSYELDVVKYTLSDISSGQVVVKWELEVTTSVLTNSNSIQFITI